MSVLSQAQRRRLKVQTLCSPAGRSPEKQGHTHFKTHRTVRFIVLSLKRSGWDTVEPWLKSGTIWASDLSPDNWKNTMKKKNKKKPKWIETDSQWLLLRDAFGAFSFLQNFRIFTVLKKKKKYDWSCGEECVRNVIDWKATGACSAHMGTVRVKAFEWTWRNTTYGGIIDSNHKKSYKISTLNRTTSFWIQIDTWKISRVAI